MAVYNANNAVCNGNVDHWLAHPDATEHDNAPIESYRSVAARVRAATTDAVQRFMRDEHDFGTLVTHAGIIDTAVVILIGTAQRVESSADIGGGFEMAQGAQLVIDKTPSGMYTVTLERNGQSYKVDLDKLR
jgi:broad specificity phosphatase PhoE